MIREKKKGVVRETDKERTVWNPEMKEIILKDNEEKVNLKC